MWTSADSINQAAQYMQLNYTDQLIGESKHRTMDNTLPNHSGLFNNAYT